MNALLSCCYNSESEREEDRSAVSQVLLGGVGGGRERVRDSKLQKTECPLLVPQNSADKISVGLLFKPVAQIETVTTMSHSPPMGARQHHCLYYPGFLTTTLVSTIPFPLTLTTCLLFLSLSISVFVRETLFSFFLFLPIHT